MIVLTIFCLCLTMLWHSTAGAEGSPDPKQAFKNLAASLNMPHSWDYPALTSSQQQSLDQLEPLADKMMQQPQFAADMLYLLNEYKNQDGFPRQKLIQSLLNARKYTAGDVPFLKSVLLASLTFHYDEYPMRLRDWYIPEDIRFTVAVRILIASGRANLVGNADESLLISNPTAWLAKYAP